MKRLLMIVSVLALAVGVLAGFAIARAKHHQSLQHEKMLHFIELTVNEDFVDVPPPVEENGEVRSGDTFFFHDVLWNPAQTERRGTVYGSCEFILNFAANCEVTAMLKKGNLVFEGVVRFPDGEDPAQFRLAAIGGTRVFKNIVGEVLVRDLPDDQGADITIHLIPSFRNPG